MKMQLTAAVFGCDSSTPINAEESERLYDERADRETQAKTYGLSSIGAPNIASSVHAIELPVANPGG